MSPSPATEPLPIEEPTPDAGACTATLSAASVLRTPGCWVDEKVSNRSAVLSYPCGGGTATAGFAAPFSGIVTAEGQVDIGTTTTFSWDDGCTWKSEQRITGKLSSGTLSYTYREAPVKGARCSSSHCVANAKVRAR